MTDNDKQHQRDTLIQFERVMGLGPVAAAGKLDTPYDTYKDWKSGRHKMPGVAYNAIGLWMDYAETKV